MDGRLRRAGCARLRMPTLPQVYRLRSGRDPHGADMSEFQLPTDWKRELHESVYLRQDHSLILGPHEDIVRILDSTGRKVDYQVVGTYKTFATIKATRTYARRL